ncbi:hypothetical protein [uncultured Photobacterium sp.]|uniref:hypothetical protein n=1 Tax=uncultured Photobacterium sp. TaxID=173973 RepID=UPI00261D3DE5|nr:hypothetical protein [uncultured Photobacterium sp.]
MIKPDGRVYTPDGWTIFHINNNGAHTYKVLGTWSVGYLDGDLWRLLSGTEDFNLICDATIGLFVSEQLSGSTYHLSRAAYQRHNAYGTVILQRTINSFEMAPPGIEISLLKLRISEDGLVTNPVESLDEVGSYERHYTRP